VTGSVVSEQQAVLGDPHGVLDHPHPDDLARVAITDAVTAREAHRSTCIDPAQDLTSGGGWCGSRCLGSTVHVGIILGQVPAGVGGHEHAVVSDLQQPVDGLHVYALTGQVAANVVPVFEDADPSGAVDPSCDRGPWRLWFALWLELWVEHVGGRALHQLEASDRRYVTDRLVLALGVRAGDPGIQLRLSVRDRRLSLRSIRNRFSRPFPRSGRACRWTFLVRTPCRDELDNAALRLA
jgi:hypothetical protein